MKNWIQGWDGICLTKTARFTKTERITQKLSTLSQLLLLIKKSLDNGKSCYISWLNIRSNPLKKRKKVECNVAVDSEQQFKRVRLLHKRLVIKDNIDKSYFSIDAIVDRMRYHKKTQYNDSSKDEALATISNEKQKIIDQLIINFD